MIIFDADRLADHLANDAVMRWLETATQQGDETFTSHRWLIESPPKRMIFHAVYGDLFACENERKKVLDVGGGFSALTRCLVRDHEYCVVDLMAHDDHARLNDAQRDIGTDFWVSGDWYDFEGEPEYDIVIANDLFPNVDQRLELFLEKFLPKCRELRTSLTYCNEHRWYRVRRTDADEVLYMLTWDGAQLQRVLNKFIDRIEESDLDRLLIASTSLFANGRQVAHVRFRGDRAR